MQGGWIGKILHVDLTKGDVRQEDLNPDMARKYIGGVGFGVKIVYDEVPPGVDALDPENPLVFATGPLTGTPALGTGSFAVITKSPLTGFTVAMGTANGLLGMKLKAAGFDAVIFRGKSERPVCLWVDNGNVELRDATRFWGVDSMEVEDLIKAEVAQPRASVASIGTAGENLVRFATVNSSFGHIAASGGLGAVMGSKKLKAIVVHGTGQIPTVDKKVLDELGREWRETIVKNPGAQRLRDYGTAGACEMLYRMGDLPVKNLTTNIFPEYPAMTGQTIRKNFNTKPKGSCWHCPLNHVHMFEIPEGPYKGFVGEEPEQETMAAFGPNLGITDTAAVLYLSNLADSLGMDCKVLGFVVSLCMECYEKGLLTREDLGGIELTWGDYKAVVRLFGMIARREGIGNILAEGTGRAAAYIGGDAPNFAVHNKGAGIHVHDFRAIWGYGFSHVISSFAGTKEGLGADLVPDADLGYPSPLDPLSKVGHAGASWKTGNKEMFSDCAIICGHLSRRGLPWSKLIDMLNAATGERFSVEDIYTAMERIRSLARAFAIRHGLTPEDDWPSERLLEAPRDGPVEGKSWRPYLKGMIADYYRYMGWDEKTSKPLRRTLKKLDLEFVIKDIWD